jgi:hypothetical protein
VLSLLIENDSSVERKLLIPTGIYENASVEHVRREGMFAALPLFTSLTDTNENGLRCMPATDLAVLLGSDTYDMIHRFVPTDSQCGLLTCSLSHPLTEPARCILSEIRSAGFCSFRTGRACHRHLAWLCRGCTRGMPSAPNDSPDALTHYKSSNFDAQRGNTAKVGLCLTLIRWSLLDVCDKSSQ